MKGVIIVSSEKNTTEEQFTDKARSKFFTDEELDKASSYTSEEMAALPKPWTKRGEMIKSDRYVIQRIVKENPVAARIFVTGEVADEYIGDAATRLLVNINKAYYGAGCEPLFAETINSTIRMTRFDPVFVWQCFHPDTLVELVQHEIGRLGVDMDPWHMDCFDFYQSMVAGLQPADGFAIPVVKRPGTIDDFYNAVYLSCLLLFGKPGYMDVPVAEHFALPETAAFMKAVKYRDLNRLEGIAVGNLRDKYKGIQALTNPEVNFVIGLYGKETE
jgi:hypothetical protein